MNIKSKKWGLIFGLILLFGGSERVIASNCNFGTVDITVEGNEFSSERATIAECSLGGSSTKAYYYQFWKDFTNGKTVSGDCPDSQTSCFVVSTNVSGLYIAVSFTFNAENNTSYNGTIVNVTDGIPSSGQFNFNSSAPVSMYANNMEIAFYAMDVKSIPEGRVSFSSSPSAIVNKIGNRDYWTDYMTGTLNIFKGFCNVTADTTSLSPLNGEVFTWNQLSSLSVGDNFGSADMNLTLSNCNESAVPGITLVDKNSTSNSTDIITLTGQDTTGVAKGVGIQGFVNGSTTAATLNKKVKYSTLGSGDSIPIVFKYVKTDSTVDVGTANGQVDIKVTYN